MTLKKLYIIIYIVKNAYKLMSGALSTKVNALSLLENIELQIIAFYRHGL